MIHSNLRVEVQGPYILVAMRGTCLMAKYRKQEAPWLAMDGYAEDFEAPMTFQEFRSLAWEAANEKARDLGWVRSYDELHEAVKRAGASRRSSRPPHRLSRRCRHDERAVVPK